MPTNDFDAMLARVAAAPPGEQLAQLRADQCRRWREGSPVTLDRYLAAANDEESALVLIVGEAVLRDPAVGATLIDEYRRRFPGLAERLSLQFALQRVIKSGAGTGDFVPDPAADTAAPVVPGYEVERELGRGGMGVVFLARHIALDRPVAIKIILAGSLAGAAARSRFQFEAEILARLRHPNVVQVYEVGTAAGQPYVALEYVEGGSLRDRLDGTPWPAGAAVTLVETLARAAHAAHLQGVVHRDLKPANVLFAPGDVPKVTDFGLAKRLVAEGASDVTGAGAILGTPAYMAPEQARADRGAVGPATDVYALGAILYELLAGRPPFKAATPMETMLLVSTREPARLTGPRDLATVVHKCLEKDPARRYPSAEALAADLRRVLDDRPVSARRTGRAERAWRSCRRNPIIASLTATLAIVFVVSLGAQSVSYFAVRRERDGALAAREETKKRAEELKLVSDFQAQMLSQVDPAQGGILLAQDVKAKFEAALAKDGIPQDDRKTQTELFATQWQRVNATDAARDLIDRTILKPAVTAIDKQFTDQPVVDAALRQVLADRYRDMGLTDAAMPLQMQALATRRRVLGEEHQDTLESINSMGVLLQSQNKPTEAEPYFRELLEKCRRFLGEDDPLTLTAIGNVGFVLQAQGKLDQAETYCRDALAKRRRLLGGLHTDTICSISNMAYLLQDQGKLEEAEPILREALEKFRRVRGPDHRDTLTSINNMALLLQAQSKYGEAEPLCREALEMRRRVLGEQHADTLASINNMGMLLLAQGKQTEAEPYLREALAKRRRLLGELDTDTIRSISNMAYLLQAQDRPDDAEPYLREALEKFRRMLGPDHRDTLTSINNMGLLLQAQKKFSEAEPLCREALEKRRRVLGEQHLDTMDSKNNMGMLLQAQGKFSEAEPYLREALATRRRVLGDGHADTIQSISNMGFLLLAHDKPDQAEPYLRESLEKFRRKLGPDHPDTLTSINNLCDLLKRQGKLTEAEQLLREAVDIVKRKFGAESPQYAVQLVFLGWCLLDEHKWIDAEPILRECLAIRQKKQPDVWTTFNVVSMLGGSLLGQDKYQDAETALLSGYEGMKNRESLIPPQGKIRLTEALERLVQLYTTWHAAEPTEGHDVTATVWKTKLDATPTANSPAVNP